MKVSFSLLKTLLHSLIAKIVILIITMAVSVILAVIYFNRIIFASTQNHDIFLLMVILIIIFISGGFFFHRLIKPIQELNKGVKEISKGNLEVNLKIGGADEVGKLAKAFNQMTKDLKRMIEARDQLLLDVSHELRTPLTRAKLALEMTNESEFTETAKKNIKEVEVMITELLESQRLRNSIDNLDISTINLQEFVNEVVNEFNNDRLVVNPISERLQIEADEKLIKIVLRNIIDNALKYSPNNAPPTEISVVDKDNKIIIQVEDFGDGLSQKEIEKVFEPFYRTDKSRSRKTGGYGLGLHLCKRIMEVHKGEIVLLNKNTTKGLKVNLCFIKEESPC